MCIRFLWQICWKSVRSPLYTCIVYIYIYTDKYQLCIPFGNIVLQHVLVLVQHLGSTQGLESDLSQPGSQLWIQQCGKTTIQRVEEKAHFNSAQHQLYNRLHQQLPWIFHGSGALPNQGHLQATAVNNRQRTRSQNTGGSSTRRHKHLHTTMAVPAGDEVTALTATHKLKLKSPTYDGNYATYEEWKCKFTAYMGLQDPFYPRMFRLAEAAAQQVTEAHLRQGATTLEEAEAWVQLDQNLKYVLINVTTGAVATLCRQNQHEIGLGVLRQLNMRFALPVGTRSIGYLTKLLKPTFDNNNSEESFSLGIWTKQVWKREQHPTTTPSQDCSLDVWNKRTTTTTPSPYSWSDANLHWHQSNHHGIQQDNHSIQQVIQRCNKLNGGAAPMDIGAINKEKGKSKHKGKGKKGKGEGKKGNKGKGYSGQGKGKGPVGQTVQYKGTETMHQEKEKDKERQPAKEKDTQQAVTDVVSQATWHKTVELQSTTFRRTSRKDTTMQLSSGMDHKPPMTTIGGQMTKRKSMQCSNHSNLHCQHLRN